MLQVPVFDSVKKTFSLNADTLKDLSKAGLRRFQGEVPSGSLVLVGHTCSWWCPNGNADAKLGLNLNWVIVLGIPA